MPQVTIRRPYSVNSICATSSGFSHTQFFISSLVKATWFASFQEAFEDLHRMNVNAASLFPGLDGFAKHLEMLVAIRGALPVDPE
jgi:hypothetical protein